MGCFGMKCVRLGLGCRVALLKLWFGTEMLLCENVYR
jgi:hypothetical protein